MIGYNRGAVVKGPDLFGGYDHSPYVCVSDESHPFGDEEALHVAVTTTCRSVPIPVTDDDFAYDVLPRESYVNPWTIALIRHADIEGTEGRLIEETTEKIAHEAAYLGVQ